MQRGGQPGNQNPAAGKRWRLAIEKALEKRGPSMVEALAEVAEQLITKASEGDISALKELGDRIDGKSVQGVELSGKDGKDLVIGLKNYVRPK
jgi:hypothetical protein